MIFDYLDEKETCREGMQPTYDVWGTVLAASENTSKGSVRVQVKNMKDNMDTFGHGLSFSGEQSVCAECL